MDRIQNNLQTTYNSKFFNFGRVIFVSDASVVKAHTFLNKND
jgi:hypothetical protein